MTGLDTIRSCAGRVPRSVVPLVLLALLVTGACAGSSQAPGPAERVVLVGIDGMDWKVVDALVADGGMPNVARFVRRGVAGDISTLKPTYSPLIWASVATGKLPPKHGITGFGRRDPDAPGRIVPYTSNARTAAAVWDILGEAGSQVGIVGWWTTWPAEPVRGVMVSDRMLFNRFNLWHRQNRSGEDLPGQTHPPELFETLAPLTRIDDDAKTAFLARFARDGASLELRENLHDPWYELFLAYRRDEAYVAMLEKVLEDRKFDFLAYYLNGPDIASHYFWKYRYPGEWQHSIPEDELEAGREVIARYYEYVDGAIAPLLEQASESCVVILMSDHGFVSGERSDSPNISGTHYRAAPPGIIAMAGGGLPEGVRMQQVSVIDIAPTVLHLMGHPVARDMDGKVMPAVLGEAVAGASDVAYVDTYPRRLRGETAPLASGYDEEIVLKLKALGYLDAADAVD